MLKEMTRYTLLIYLNSNYEGGETNTIKPETGKALIFDIDLWHSELPVINGEKYWIGCEIIGKMK